MRRTADGILKQSPLEFKSCVKLFSFFHIGFQKYFFLVVLAVNFTIVLLGVSKQEAFHSFLILLVQPRRHTLYHGRWTNISL